MATTQPKIFKKIEVIEGGGHHGGGWKVAYADFMTAMMAFFLLMWILASSDEQKLRGIAEYFTTATMPGGSGVLDGATLGPPGTLTASNGSIVARGSELGKNDDAPAVQWEVRDVTETSQTAEQAGGSPASDESEQANALGDGAETQSEPMKAESDVEAVHPVDDMKFKQLQIDILQAMQDNPVLEPLQKNVVFEKTPEGLHIQIIDQDGKPMFRSGRSEFTSATESLLSNLGKSLAMLPNRVTIAGHTDSVPFAKSANYDNWDLSTDRANATRRVFEASGVDRSRIIRVSGMADTQPLVPDDKRDASNRRISIKVQYRHTSGQDAPTTQMMNSAAAKGDSDKSDKMMMASDQSSQAMTKPAAMKTGPKNVTKTAEQLDDQVFKNLRNALR